MGYSMSRVSVDTFVPSDDILIINAAQAGTALLAYTKVKSIMLMSDIGTTSLFRFKFNLYSGDGVNAVFGKIYRNGVAIGTERTTAAGSPGTEFIENIVSTNWTVGDTIELRVKANAFASGYVANFKLCGIGSEFFNSLV